MRLARKAEVFLKWFFNQRKKPIWERANPIIIISLVDLTTDKPAMRRGMAA